jgi:MFS family permease
VIQARPKTEAIVTSTAAALWAVTFLGYTSQGLLQPILPLYLKNLGGSELIIGLALAAFSATSFSLRPVVGHFTDRWSVAGVLALGVLVLGLSSVAFAVPWIWLIFVVSAVRGIGWASLNTAGTTLLALIAPAHRRAEAAGLVSIFQSAANAIGSPLALWLVGLSITNFNLVFAIAGAAGLLAFVIARPIPDPLPRAVSPKAATRGVRLLVSMLDRDVALPMFLQACLLLVFPALTSFVALYAQRQGLSQSSVAIYFLGNGLTVIVTRLALGRVSDVMDRGASAAIGFAIIMGAIVLMVYASSEAILVASGVVFAIGYSITIASLTALAIDMANPQRLGAAMATYSMANQLGAGVGAAAAGALIEAAGYRVMYVAMLVPGAVALVGLWLARRRIKAAVRHVPLAQSQP